MSHFSVMVIGENPEKQLAPFDEYLVSPHSELEKYKNDYKQSSKKIGFASYLKKYYGFTRIRKSETPPKQSYFVVENRRVIDVVEFYNPIARWDWHKLGGRWDGFLLLKDSNQNRANQSLKKYIDFKGMIDSSLNTCVKRYDEVRNCVEPYLGVSYISFEKIRAGEPNIEKARARYHEQPIVQAFYGIGVHSNNIDDFLLSREEFIAKHQYLEFCPFAFLQNGEWHEKGKMSLWGIVSDKDENWPANYMKLLESVGDDELISIYDCHI